MKAIITKASIDFADMDRHIYCEHQVTLARHPNETEERLMVRLIAYALNAPQTNANGELTFAKDLWNADEPCLWQKDLTGDVVHWIDVGHPDEKRILRYSARSEKVSIYAYGTTAPEWWQHLAPRITRTENVAIWQFPAEQSEALSVFVHRSINININIQDGAMWISDDAHSVEINLQCLRACATEK